MFRAVALPLVALALFACSAAPAATKEYRSAAGYSISYPSNWAVKANGPRTFSASGPGGTEYLVVVVIGSAATRLLASHEAQLARVSDRSESRAVDTTFGSAAELWSSRTEKDGRVGIYQQYFVSTSIGTIWVQHGCLEPGPEVSESADRDCDDSGLGFLKSVRLTA